MFQMGAFAADAVDVGGFELGVAGEAHRPGGLIVGEDEDDVGPFGDGGVGGEQGSEGEHDRCDGDEVFLDSRSGLVINLSVHGIDPFFGFDRWMFSEASRLVQWNIRQRRGKSTVKFVANGARRVSPWPGLRLGGEIFF